MYKKNISGFRKHLDFILIDLFCLELSFVLSAHIRNGLHFSVLDSELYRTTAVMTGAACLFCASYLDSMKNILKRGAGKELYTSIMQSAGVLLLTNLFLFAVKQGDSFSRIVLFLTAALYCAMSFGMRCLWKKILRRRIKSAPSKLLIISDMENTGGITGSIRADKTKNYDICGIARLNERGSETAAGDVPVIAAGEKEIIEIICRDWVDEVFICLSGGNAVPSEFIDKLISTGVTIHISIPDICTMPLNRCIIEKIAGNTAITFAMRTAKAEQLFIKRLIDILGGIAGCIITGVIFIFLAPAIKLSSPGKVFFSQERIGLNGKKFRMYKFRSMYSDAESRKKELASQNRIADGMMFKLDYDPRIIGCKMLPDGTVKKGLGNFIRESSLDEFPQFFNVLKGDMSLVGTRPPTTDEWERYELRHRVRMSIKPGITGLWQISGRSGITDFEQVVELDKKYINEWSIGLDLKILLKTVLVVIKRKGSM
ncbi:MAG: sugar transferase [Ruminococcus sp.]|nr:sugar transferase [Ruminococcus sp.]